MNSLEPWGAKVAGVTAVCGRIARASLKQITATKHPACFGALDVGTDPRFQNKVHHAVVPPRAAGQGCYPPAQYWDTDSSSSLDLWYGLPMFAMGLVKSPRSTDWWPAAYAGIYGDGRLEYLRRCPTGRLQDPNNSLLGLGSYAINGADWSDAAPLTWTKYDGICQAQSYWFPYPDQTAMILDVQQGLGQNWTYRIFASSGWYSDMHQGGGNVLYLDGHGQFLPHASVAANDPIFFGIYPQGRTSISP